MSLGVHCDNPACDTWALDGTLTAGFLTVTGWGEQPQHFCGWGCLMVAAAAHEPSTLQEDLT